MLQASELLDFSNLCSFSKGSVPGMGTEANYLSASANPKSIFEQHFRMKKSNQLSSVVCLSLILPGRGLLGVYVFDLL
jgi:hypothetical protein